MARLAAPPAFMSLIIFACTATRPTAAAAAYGLLVDLKAPPSLGVALRPSFSWLVPLSPSLSEGQRQSSYRVVVSSSRAFEVPLWDSGRVASSQQSHVRCNVSLSPAHKYFWRVHLETTDDQQQLASFESDMGSFVTALDHWDARTKPIWAGPAPAEPTPVPAPRQGRFIKPDSPSPCPVPGYPNGCMWYERFNDSSKHFVTNCGEHPSFCHADQLPCFGHLHQWLDEAVRVNTSYFNELSFKQGDNFTCSEEPAEHSLQQSPSAFGSFVMARTEVALPSPVETVLVFVTAAPVGTVSEGHSRRLLGQYNLWVGGSFVGLGPGRPDDNVSLAFDTFDVSELVRAANGTVVVALQGYNKRPAAKMMLQLHLTYTNGTTAVYGTNQRDWQAADVSRVFGLGPQALSTGGAYSQPQEHLDARLYPHGWLEPSQQQRLGWAPAVEPIWHPHVCRPDAGRRPGGERGPVGVGGALPVE